MAHRLITSVRKADRVLKNGLLNGNFNIFAQVQPKSLELSQFISQRTVHSSTNPPKGFRKFFGGLKEDKKSSNLMTGENEEGLKSSLLPGDRDGQGDSKGKSSDTGFGWKYKIRILATASILGVCWVYLKKNWKGLDFNWKDFADKLLGQSSVENGEMETDLKTNVCAALNDLILLEIIFLVCFCFKKRRGKIGPKELLLVNFAFLSSCLATFIACIYCVGEFKTGSVIEP